MNGVGDQPEITEPEIKVGETVWYDENGSRVGKIISIVNNMVSVKYHDRVSSYPIHDLNCAFLPPYLVLVAGLKEKVIHQFQF